MARNTKKIRREIEINGQKRWVTADMEQEYASKLMAGFEPATSSLPRIRPTN